MKRKAEPNSMELLRARPHPVAQLLKDRWWNDQDPNPHTGEVDEHDYEGDHWRPHWRVVRARMETRGLPVIFLDARIDPDTGFAALYFWTNDERHLPRLDEHRGFDLHLSIGYESDYQNPQRLYDAFALLNAEYGGKFMYLKITSMAGTANLAPDDELAKNEDIKWLHDNGRYWKRSLHISL